MNLNELYKKIINLKSYTPSKEVDFLFGELVSFAITDGNEITLNKHEVNNIRRICAEAEFELEKYWAQKIINSKNPSIELKRFPYFQNYIDLVDLEFKSINMCPIHSGHEFLFIGGGPLPLTAILLASTYGIKSKIIDTNPEAIKISEKLINLLKLQNLIRVEKSDALEFSDYHEFSVIFIAALVGSTKTEKNSIYKKIKDNSSKSSHIITRSSKGSRELLYAPVTKDIDDYFENIFAYHPRGNIINSILIYENSKK